VKKISCSKLGGDCTFVLNAETCNGMIAGMWSHLTEKHPVLLSAIVTTDELQWRKAVQAEWDASPALEPAPNYPNLD